MNESNQKKSMDSLKDTLNDIKLFSQHNYCFNYIRNNNKELTEEIVEKHADISSACFRQSLEFLTSASTAPLSTSPLLYSYCLNNMIKGAIYLKVFDDVILNNFGKHGLSIKEQSLKENLLNTSISLWKNGVTVAILTVMNNHVIEPQQIKFSSLLSRIPNISDIYFKTTSNTPFVAIRKKTSTSDYEVPCINIEEIEKEQDVFNIIGFVGTYLPKYSKLVGGLNLKGKNYINDNNLGKDIYYNNNIIFPQMFNEGIYSINIMFYTYLIIMGYGMLVRYNAHKWEKYIDPKISNEFVLISTSVDECVKIFIDEIHNYLFGYKYIQKDYTDEDVKRIISESTEDIMDNIKKTDRLRERQFGL